MTTATITPKPIAEVDTIAIRFAGDSGDGMQLAGMQFSNTSAVFGNDINTLPDFPAEIRAPAGTLFGVSGFQINFSSHDIHTPGDMLDALVAMNPAALKTNIKDLRQGGMLIVNIDEFTPQNFKKAHIEVSPLEDGSLSSYQVHPVKITSMTLEAVAPANLTAKNAERCKNFFALGLMCWMFDRPLEPILAWIDQKFGKVPAVAEANRLALKTGFNYGETAEVFRQRYTVRRAHLPPGTYRSITGNEATAIGLVAAAQRAGLQLYYASYPITPASDVLHELSRFKHHNVITFQAEDEIAAMASVIGASFAGVLAVTGTAGPGLDLKAEAIGLAATMELPCIIVDVQRGGPSTGLPTKTEQSDLLHAMFGRHGECPVPIIAAQSPADCFNAAIEAARIALTRMTPVILLTDGYLANGAEPWRIPDPAGLPDLKVQFAAPSENGNGANYLPYERDARLARKWAIPGTRGLEHRLGGLEKQDVTGNVCYDPENHQRMTDLRQAKVDRVADDIPPLKVKGPETGRLLVIGWGSTYGAISSAVERAQQQGKSVAQVHLRHMNPFPKNLEKILRSYDRVLVTEMNMGQLRFLLRARFLIDAVGLNKVQGKPFMIGEISAKIDELLG